MEEVLRIGSVSLVQQGSFKFYSFTMYSDYLADTCFVTTRDEDPEEGFQRSLDEARARKIAAYIDEGLGTIPSSIVLSAQECSEFKYDSKTKSVSFRRNKKSFLVIDGQHRVYGFKLAQQRLRVPVVVYSGLTKRDESRLFIDINSLQKGVSSELLLDIKKMAEYESDTEGFLREIFDYLSTDSASCLYGRMSPSSRQKGKISRSVFNLAVKPLIKYLSGKSEIEAAIILNSYFIAFKDGVFAVNDIEDVFFETNVFKALCALFPRVSSRVKDKYGAVYTVDNYYDVISILRDRIKISRIKSNGNSYKSLVSYFDDLLNQEFSL